MCSTEFTGRATPVQMRKNLRLVKPGEQSEPAPKPEPVGEDMLWMTAPIDDKSTAWIMEYTWTPSNPPEPAARPKLRRRK
jgi:hypothetical protein